MRKKWYYLKLEENRAKNRKRKANQRFKRGDEINAYQRANYARDRRENAFKQNQRRRKRLPYIGLRKAVRDCERGILGEHELAKLVWQSLAGCFETNPAARRIGKSSRGLHWSEHKENIEKSLPVGSNQN